MNINANDLENWENATMRLKLPQIIYRKLDKLIGIDDFMKTGAYLKLKAKDFHDLLIKKLEDKNQISISTYGVNYAGVISPDVTVKVKLYPEKHEAEILCYSDGLKNEDVYTGNKVNLKLKKQLNSFLNGWLDALLRIYHG